MHRRKCRWQKGRWLDNIMITMLLEGTSQRSTQYQQQRWLPPPQLQWRNNTRRLLKEWLSNAPHSFIVASSFTVVSTLLRNVVLDLFSHCRHWLTEFCGSFSYSRGGLKLDRGGAEWYCALQNVKLVLTDFGDYTTCHRSPLPTDLLLPNNYYGSSYCDGPQD